MSLYQLMYFDRDLEGPRRSPRGSVLKSRPVSWDETERIKFLTFDNVFFRQVRKLGLAAREIRILIYVSDAPGLLRECR